MTKWTFLLVATLLSQSVLGQLSLSKKDSVEIKTTTESFFSWYAELMRTNKIRDFNPQFVKKPNGMTTLDFSRYRDGLREHRFTEDLIANRIRNYKKCLDNLNSIPFDTFLKFEGLDQFEEIDCDFSNGYEFIGGMMDPIDGADLVVIKLLDKKRAVSIVTLFYMTGEEKNPLGQRTITLTKVKKNWKISDH